MQRGMFATYMVDGPTRSVAVAPFPGPHPRPSSRRWILALATAMVVLGLQAAQAPRAAAVAGGVATFLLVSGAVLWLQRQTLRPLRALKPRFPHRRTDPDAHAAACHAHLGRCALGKWLDVRGGILHGRSMSDGFPDVRAVFEDNLASGADVGASFCATVEGETVVDLWGGFADAARTRPWREDTIVNVYSTTKTMTALTALLVADRGELDFEAPVARYWPEFAANGKDGVTVAHLMSHSAGLSGWREPITREDLYDWEKVTALLAAQAPFWKPGTASGYHALTQGYLVGEVVRRITGRSLGTVFREEIAEPLGADFHIGLPASEDAPGRRADPAAGPGRRSATRVDSELQDNVADNPGSTSRPPGRGPGAAPRSRRPAAPATPARSPRSTRSWPTAASPRAGASCPRPAAAGRWSCRSRATT